MEEWQRLVHVCQRWRQIIHGSPIYLDLLLHCSNRPVKKDLPGGFLGGSAPRLQRLILGRVPFPTLPTLLLSARDLVHLRYDLIPPTGYISPEAMVADLAVLTRLETLVIQFYPLVYLPEQRRRCPEPSMRAVLPALTDFEFGGFGEYSEDFMAQIDGPRFHRVTMILHRFDCLRVHQLFLFIDRTENFRPSRVRVNLCNGHIDIHLVAGHPSSRVLRPHFSFSTPLEWSNTQVAYLTLVLSRMSAMCSHVQYQYLAIYDCENRPVRVGTTISTAPDGWHSSANLPLWKRIYGGLAAQVVRALGDVPGEMVTEVLSSLHSLWVDTSYREPVNLKLAEQFIALRRLYGRPVTICDRHYWDESFEGVRNPQ